MARCGHDLAERERATHRWFERFHELSAEQGLTRQAERCVAKSNVRAREKMDEFFRWLERYFGTKIVRFLCDL